jgi:hypothetical protein
MNNLIDEMIAGMFDQVTSMLMAILTNDLMVVVMIMLSLILILTGYLMIRDFLGLGLSDSEKSLKNAYGDLQRHKGSWKQDIYKNNYRRSLSEYYTERDEREKAEEYSADNLRMF